ncbi:MAG: aspartate--tRNA ligase [Candidatus Pacebacteria bacterium]|nr:aspartate--tRNA ligase [Candidatus Paceibacterota bacterium]
MRTLIKDIIKKEGEIVELSGWVSVRRDHGKLIFIDLRDRSGMTQVVFLPGNAEAHKTAEEIRPEWVVKIKGSVNRRPDNMVNKDMETGEFEIEALEIEILNKAETPPIEIQNDGYEIGEEIRMKYRYLDLRRNRLQKNIRKRAKIMSFVRSFLEKNDFIEIETPILTKSTPEGARDYLVPSRVYPGKFYALPQSPQQYKQLLMVGGMEKYFQMAKCFRDEDTRGDRQPEFTQLDMEMSFVEMKDVMELNENLLVEIIEKFYPEKKIQEKPFPVITYKEAMEKYGTDRPDLRKDKSDSSLLAFCWVVDFPFFEKTEEGGWTFTHNPFSAPKPEFINDLLDKKDIGKILTTQYDVALNGIEVGGGSIRNHKPEALLSTLEIIGIDKEKAEKNFGHMLEAFKYGTPPHGGIAWGFDRFIMLLEGEPNIREVMAFPKTGDGRDLMMEAPSEAEEKQLKELKIKFGS